MRITRVQVIGQNTIDFPIVGMLPTDSFHCISIEGLGPTKRITQIAETVDGVGDFQGAASSYRQIVMKVALNPQYADGETPGMLREQLYGLFYTGPSKVVTFDFYNGVTHVARQLAIVESIEPVMFAKDLEVQIVANCRASWLSGVSDVTLVSPPLGDTDDPAMVYEGTRPTGFKFEVEMTADHSLWRILKDGVQTRFEFDFETGDILTVDSRPGSKGTTLTRDAVETNMVGYLHEDSVWLELYPGTNTFDINTAGFTWNYFALYKPLYWGI